MKYLTKSELKGITGGNIWCPVATVPVVTPLVVGGVVIGWKVVAGVGAIIAGGAAIGIAAGYYANRP